jgi:NADH-quinone oxidoreductase subunit K
MTAVPLEWCLLLSAALFTIGFVGVLTRRNVLVIFMSVELMMNAANLSFVAFDRALNLITGQAFVVFIVSVAAAEAAVGLAIIIAFARQKATVDVDEVHLLKE